MKSNFCKVSVIVSFLMLFNFLNLTPFGKAKSWITFDRFCTWMSSAFYGKRKTSLATTDWSSWKKLSSGVYLLKSVTGSIPSRSLFVTPTTKNISNSR